MMRAPAAASARAVARPIPRDAPVTSAVLLVRVSIVHLLSGVKLFEITLGHEDGARLAVEPRLCMLKPCFISMDREHGAPAFALFRCGGRGRQPHQRRRAAAAHGPAIAEPADP